MTKLGLSPLYIVNRDRTEIDVLLKQFANVDLRPLYTPKEAEWALASLQRQDIKLCVGVGAIPSFEPQTAEEKQLYDTATLLFKQAGPAKQDTQTAVPSEGDHLLIPHRPIFLDMAYKVDLMLSRTGLVLTVRQPRMTILRSIGEEHGWNTLCGVEVVAELCVSFWHTTCTVGYDVRLKWPLSWLHISLFRLTYGQGWKSPVRPVKK